LTTGVKRAPGSAYESAGRNVALAVRGYSSVVVTSDDLVAAAHVAIGIALAESATRLVVIGDLADDVAPLQKLMAGDDTHGIYDSFVFGTSLGKIARPVEGTTSLFFMPSGTESAATMEILSDSRWKRFAAESASSDELLLLVVGASAPGLDRLVAQMDGVVLVGLQKLDAVPDAVLLAKVQHPPTIAPPRIDRASRPKSPPAAAAKTWNPRTLGIAAAALLALGIIAGALYSWLSGKPSSTSALPANSAAGSPAGGGATSSRRASRMRLSNPQDSLAATAFSVEILGADTAEEANFELQRHRGTMPAATIAVVPVGEGAISRYKLFAGAFSDSAEAGQLLSSLRRRNIVSRSAGRVVRAPFALLIDSVSASDGASSRAREKLQNYFERDIPAYSLVQRNGGMKLYVGAFENPDESSMAARVLSMRGLSPVLAYRTGRAP